MDDERPSLKDSIPLVVMHAACLGALWTGVSASALAACAITYLVRVFALTAGYHRFFSHNSFRTGRAFQFVLAFLGSSAAQLGPLWWASHHRLHHQVADTERDIHSPARRGFWWAHVGWLLCPRYAKADFDRVKDFARFPELRFLDRHPYVAPAVLALALLGIGHALSLRQVNTSGAQMVVWGFFISTVLVYHVTFSINSLMHMFGTRPYNTPDTSRNNWALALLTLGEGWHNNHHRWPVSARQGFRWWELDMTYLVLRVLETIGVVSDVRRPPEKILAEARG